MNTGGSPHWYGFFAFELRALIRLTPRFTDAFFRPVGHLKAWWTLEGEQTFKFQESSGFGFQPLNQKHATCFPTTPIKGALRKPLRKSRKAPSARILGSRKWRFRTAAAMGTCSWARRGRLPLSSGISSSLGEGARREEREGGEGREGRRRGGEGRGRGREGKGGRGRRSEEGKGGEERNDSRTQRVMINNRHTHFGQWLNDGPTASTTSGGQHQPQQLEERSWMDCVLLWNALLCPPFSPRSRTNEPGARSAFCTFWGHPGASLLPVQFGIQLP